MPLPLTVSCFSKILIGFTFLVLAYPGSPGKRAVKRVCVCVVCLLVIKIKSSSEAAWLYLCVGDMGVFVTSGVCVCMCDCVVFEFFIVVLV